MFEFLGTADNLVFVVALGAMALVGLVELTGLGGAALGHDLGIDLHADADWLGWLGFGRLPLLMMLVLFLALFACIGLVGQQLALDRLGHLIPALAAGPAAAVLALPMTGLLARPLARILPKDETTAIDIERLVGLHAEIIVGRATIGSPAKARVRDYHGQVHYVMAEPDMPGQSFTEGDEVLLVSRQAHVFRAISSDRPPFSKWIET